MVAAMTTRPGLLAAITVHVHTAGATRATARATRYWIGRLPVLDRPTPATVADLAGRGGPATKDKILAGLIELGGEWAEVTALAVLAPGSDGFSPAGAAGERDRMRSPTSKPNWSLGRWRHSGPRRVARRRTGPVWRWSTGRGLGPGPGGSPSFAGPAVASRSTPDRRPRWTALTTVSSTVGAGWSCWPLRSTIRSPTDG